MLFIERRIAVNVVKSELLQEVLADASRDFERKSVVRRKRVYADELHYLVKVIFKLERFKRSSRECHPVLCDVLVAPVGKAVAVERIGVKPVYGGEVASVGERRIKSPENFDDTERRLCDRLGNITALRRHRAYRAECALASVGTEADDFTRSFVESRKSGGKVGGIALLTRHFFKSSRHFAQSLRPS